jgi:mannosyltransferase
MTQGKPYADAASLDVIAPHFKLRLSGVTSTVIQLVPVQAAAGLRIATLGPGLPDHLPKMRWRDLWRLWLRPQGGGARVWHARRNVEMVAGVVLRDVLRMPLRLLFTSAAQRHHQPFTKWLIRRMDAVVATGRKSAGFLDVPFTIVMHGIDTARFTPPADKKMPVRSLGLDPAKKHVGCFGRVRHQKGTDLFVDAMIALLPRHPEWAALICGRVTPDQRDFASELQRRIAEAGLTERIRFLGEVPDILPMYQAIDLYVAPSRNEGFGLTPLEAMACGIPVVATNAGAYEDMVVDGVNGALCNAGDGAALEAALARLLDPAADIAALGGEALRSVRRDFTLDREALALMGIYRPSTSMWNGRA